MYGALVFSSMILQGAVLITSLLAFLQIPDRKSWVWFILAAAVVFVRRMAASFRVSSEFDTLIVESLMTSLISLLWVVYIFMRIREHKRHRCRHGTCKTCPPANR